MPDATSGSDRYSGEWTLTGYNHDFDSSEGSPVTIEANLVNDGAISLLEIGT